MVQRREHPGHSVSTLLAQQQEEVLLERVEKTLQGIAAHWIRRFGVADLEPEDVVAEVYLRLKAGLLSSFLKAHQATNRERMDRYDFYGYFSAVARTYLIDHVRTMNAQSRGGNTIQVPAGDDLDVGVPPVSAFAIDFDRALDELRPQFPRQSHAFYMRLCGWDPEEIAEELGTSRATVNRDIRDIRLRLIDRLRLSKSGSA
jgi:RNA polymerase sigma factor (sigma-70 family)